MSNKGNVMLANMIRWSWDEIKAGRPHAASLTGASASTIMEECVKIIEENVEATPNEENDR